MPKPMVDVSLAQILGAEIMRVGKWKGHTFTDQDLSDIAAAAAEVGYIPPLKKGHDESVGARAWGWVQNIRVEGEKLLGDLMDVPDSMAAIIRERGYDQLSAEIAKNLERGGKSFKNALWAVALLGAEIPAVSGLKPLHELPVFAGSNYTRLIFTNQPEGGRTMPEKTPGIDIFPDSERGTDGLYDKAGMNKLREEAAALKAKAEAQEIKLAEQKASSDAQAAEFKALKEQSEAQAAELKTQKEQTLALQAKNREIALTAKLDAWKGPPALRPHIECLWRAAAEFPRTVRFAADPAKPEDISLEAAVDHLAHKLATDTSWMFKTMAVVGGRDHYEDPGAEVDTRIKKLIAEKPGLDYKAASKLILDADPELKQAYAGV